MLTKLKNVAWQLTALALAALLGLQTLRLHSAELAAAASATTLATERESAERQARKKSEDERQKERRLSEDHEKLNGATQAAINAAVGDAGRAYDARNRLQRELADYITAHRNRAMAAAAAGQCAPDTNALDLLADLQRRADDRAGELAAIADNARIRGSACERTHDADRATLNAAGDHAQTR